MLLEHFKSYLSYQRSPYLSIKHSTYFPVYDHLFSKYIGKNITFVEIGVLDGGSLHMWRDLFGPQARIIGIDLNPAAKKWENSGFEIYIGNQASSNFWSSFYEHVGDIDILLDDGGHTYEQQIVTVDSSLKNVSDDGLIVIEDTHTSYMKEFGAPTRYSFIEYAKKSVDTINSRFSQLETRDDMMKIWSVSFFESFVVFNINSKLTTIVSESTSNNGKQVKNDDFRYDDSGIMNLINDFELRFPGITQVKGFGFIRRKAQMLNNILRIKKVKRFF